MTVFPATACNISKNVA